MIHFYCVTYTQCICICTAWYAMACCMSACHMQLLCKNGCMDWAVFLHTGYP